MDSNPYKSPPPDLLAEGISTVMQYVRVRMQRIDRMYNLILERCEQLAETPPPKKCHSKSATNFQLRYHLEKRWDGGKTSQGHRYEPV